MESELERRFVCHNFQLQEFCNYYLLFYLLLIFYRVFESIKGFPNGVSDKDLSKEFPQTSVTDRVKAVNSLLQKVSFRLIIF